MKKILPFIFLSIGMTCFSQTDVTEFNSFIHTEHSYLNDSGQGIIIQNSYPKGGGVVNGDKGYTSPRGGQFSNGNFWSRFVNKSDKPITINLQFPADSFYYDQPVDTYFKLFVYDFPLSPEQLTMYNYGLDTFSLAYFLDSNFGKPTTLKKTIQPGEDLMFFVVQLAHLPHNGPIRAGFTFEEGKLIYKINVDPFGEQEFVAGTLSND